MERQWKIPKAWERIGTSSHQHPPAPQLPPRPKVRVRAPGRADGSPCMMVDGQSVQPGEIILVPADDVPMLAFAGRAELL